MAYNSYLVTALATWAVAQLLKFTIAALRGRLDFRYLYASGDMPSVHSAVVVALAVTALLVDGADSSIFGLAAVLAGIVMYDSLGVRRAAGEQAAALNLIISGLGESRIRTSQPIARLREVLGHSPLEVVVGALLGAVLGVLFNIDRAGALIDVLSAVPAGRELIAWAAAAGVILLSALVLQILSRRARSSAAARSRWLARLGSVLGGSALLLGVLVFLAYERLAPLGSRGLIGLVVAVMAAWVARISVERVRVQGEVAAEAEAKRKAKWLPEGSKKKRA